MRGNSGAILRADGSSFSGDVTPRDERAYRLSLLLEDFSRPGLCLILGAGASYGVVPMSRGDLTRAARELREANGIVDRLPSRYQEMFADRYVLWIAEVLGAQSTTSDWDAVLDDFWPSLWSRRRRASSSDNPFPSDGEASILLHEMFTPKDVPPELQQIYRVLEYRMGAIITYNYDRIVDETSGFRIIAPHGQRSALASDPVAWERVKRMAYEFNVPVKVDMHLPIAENDTVATRPDYNQMLHAWRSARCVALIGYGFGAGADAISYEDFGRNIQPATTVHVLCPNPDNRDLTKQVGYALKGRCRGGRVVGHPFRWRPLAASILEALRDAPEQHVRHAIAEATEIAARHDRT